MTERQSFSRKMFIPLFVVVIIVVFVWVGCIWWRCPAEEVTTIFLVRHADRDFGSDDLNLEGEQRANELAEVLSKVEIDAIYSTDTSRTKATVQPLATSKSLEIKIYGNEDLLVDEVKQDSAGGEVLIVGHSNTVPVIIDKFVGESTGYFIAPNEFYKIFILTISESGEWWVVQLKYGVVP